MRNILLIIGLFIVVSINAQGFTCYDCETPSTIDELTTPQLAAIVNFFADEGELVGKAKHTLFVGVYVDAVHIKWVFKICRQIENAARSVMRQNHSNPLPTSQADLLSQIMTIFEDELDEEEITSGQVDYVLTRIISHSHRTGVTWDGDWNHYAGEIVQ